MLLDKYMKKDPRKFFSPVFEYGISEYISGKEKPLEKLGYKYGFSRIPRGTRLVIVGFGAESLVPGLEEKGFEGEVISAWKLFAKVEAGQLPVLHNHLLFNGCPHPIIDDLAFSEIERKGGFYPVLEDDLGLDDYVVRFKDVFHDWSSVIKALIRDSKNLEAMIQSQKGLEYLYSMSQILGFGVDVQRIWGKIERIKSLPKRPNLDIIIVSKSR